ncbi:MAG: DUF4266 domain-containing protein [Polyangiaceae bacterium]
MPPTPVQRDRQRSSVAVWLLLALIAVTTAVAGCAPVAPYQRGRLADPSMAPGFAESAANDHVQAVQEGAVGGKVGVGSGCGCN